MFTLINPEQRLDSRAWLESLDYRLLSTELELRTWVSTIPDGATLGADWETDRLNRFTGPVPVGLGLATTPDSARYLPIHHTTDPHLNLPEGLVRELMQELDAHQIKTVWWNYIYDSDVMKRRWGWEPAYWHDAMVACWIWDPTQHDLQLKATTRRLLGRPAIEFDTITSGRSFQELSPRDATAYVCGDCSNTLGIWQRVVTDMVFKSQQLIYDKIERPFLPVLRDEVAGGVPIDVGYVEEINETLGVLDDNDIPQSGLLLEQYETLIQFTEGQPINLNAPRQIGDMLLRQGVPIVERTDTGQIATGKEILEQYEHPACKAITRYRELMAAKRNYVEKLREGVQRFASPWLRFQFRQCGAPTGRMACGGDGGGGKTTERAYDAGYVPLNAQAIPDPEKRPTLPNLRAAFLPWPKNDPQSEDWVWVAADMSQVELRIAAALSGEPKMVESFRRGEDIHLTNARLAYGANVGEELRGAGKTMGFATLYQASDETVASHGNISLEAATKLTTTFKANTPKLQQYIAYLKEHGRQHGFVQTYFGRRRPLATYFNAKSYAMQSQGERFAVNMPIQGTAADLFKIASVKVHKACVERGWQDRVRQLVWVHDELGLRVHKSILVEALPVIRAAMEFEVKGWPVALKVDIGVGPNWGVAKLKSSKVQA